MLASVAVAPEWLSPMRDLQDRAPTTSKMAAALAAVFVVAALTLAWAVPASAAPVSKRFTEAGSYTWTVPPGIESVRLTVAGAQGGGALGGRGAIATGVLPVRPGQQLLLTVGGRGTSVTGGFGGGGPGGWGRLNSPSLFVALGGYGGGGASRVVTDVGDAVVAGGGGGQAPASVTTWNAGGDSGSAAAARVYRCDGEGGQGGWGSAGGAGGGGGLFDHYCVVAGGAGGAGTRGMGGAGGSSPFSDDGWVSAGGGGGGGGYYGGGGGGSSGAGLVELMQNNPGPSAGGGGGGGSFIDVRQLMGTVADGAHSGTGMIEISYEDAWAPSSTRVVSPALPASTLGWYRSDITVAWNWTDRGEIDPGRCTQTTTFHPPTAAHGLTQLASSCADVSGNVSSATWWVKYDTSPPTAWPSYDAATNTVTWRWRDAGSGLDPHTAGPGNCPTSSLLLRGHLVTCTDVAGNVTTLGIPVHR